MNRNHETAMRELSQIHLKLEDLLLYLDTHPNDEEAIKMYNETANKSNMMKQNIETLYHPITITNKDQNTAPWKWIDSPWPWTYKNGGEK